MTKPNEDLPADPGEQGLLFGLLIPQIYPWPEMVQHARHVERLGFSSLWLADHFVNPYDPGGNWFESWTALAALAASTTTIRLGTAVTHIVYRNPAILAKAALTVDHISNGRLDLGMGVGAAGDYNYGMTGVHPRSTRERVDRYHEAVQLIDQLLRQEITTYQGRYYWVQDAQMRPTPIQKPRPPLNLAAHYPRSLRIAATYGDAWNSFYPGRDLTPEAGAQVTKQRGVMLTQFAEDAGRDPSTIRRTFFVGYSSDTPFATGGAFVEFIGRYQEAGIQEFILGYLPGREDEALREKWIVDTETLEQIALEAIPLMKRSMIDR